MIDELIREVTESGEGNPGARSAARERLLAAIGKTVSEPNSGAAGARRGGLARRKTTRRVIGVIAALLAVPAGVAVAIQLDRGEVPLEQVSSCPELAAAADARALSTDGLLIDGCPDAQELDETIELLARLDRVRTRMSAAGESSPIGVVGGSSAESWGLAGVAGPQTRDEAMKEAMRLAAPGGTDPRRAPSRGPGE